jgi:hypothetical protein
MFYKAKVAVCSEIRTKHINAMWAPRNFFLILNLVVCKITARLWKVNVALGPFVFVSAVLSAVWLHCYWFDP